METYNGIPESASHVIIRYKHILFDCEKTTKEFDVYPYKFETTNIDFIQKSILNTEAWNSIFNRDKYLPIMEKKIGIKLFGE